MSQQTYDLEFDDIQGFILRGYGKLPWASYVCVRIQAVSAFQAWLSTALAHRQITPASVRSPSDGVCQSLAFTASGLKALLGDAVTAAAFTEELAQGMTDSHRQRLLGDYADNNPEAWRWGHDDGIDAVVIVVGAEQADINECIAQTVCEANGLALVSRQDAHIPTDGKEPFGFMDGVSQPVLKGTDRERQLRYASPKEHQLHAVDPGEFILGYHDGSGALPRSPAISPAQDPDGYLKPHQEQAELRDFGRNGSYLVVRQLAQGVDSFNAYVEAQSDESMDIAEKMVGRRRDGCPIAHDPSAETDNDFDFLADLNGKGCPVGSHVRRSNPRSTVHASSRELALNVTNRHRILRRGRVYNNDNETGLMFLCLNSSISRQFEFVQSTWCNNPLFQNMNNEVDPLIGNIATGDNRFTAPAAPFRKQVNNLKQWVTVKGGAYFFMPGLAALKVLSEVGPAAISR